MLASLLWTLAGLVGAGGGVGLAALFVPSVAAILKSVLDFLRSPLGTMLGGIALVLFLYASGYIAGDMRGDAGVRAEWKADIAAREKAEAAREAALRNEMELLAGRVLANDEAFGKHIDNEVHAHVAQNAKRPECRATDDDVRRLLSIQ